MKTQLTILLLFCLSLISFAQHDNSVTHTINGIVTSEGKPVAFATVSIKGTSNGSVCDDNGKFSLSSKHGEFIITVQAVGYISVDKKIHLETASVPECRKYD